MSKIDLWLWTNEKQQIETHSEICIYSLKRFIVLSVCCCCFLFVVRSFSLSLAVLCITCCELFSLYHSFTCCFLVHSNSCLFIQQNQFNKPRQNWSKVGHVGCNRYMVAVYCHCLLCLVTTGPNLCSCKRNETEKKKYPTLCEKTNRERKIIT